jgi:hypothetical protein
LARCRKTSPYVSGVSQQGNGASFLASFLCNTKHSVKVFNNETIRAGE